MKDWKPITTCLLLLATPSVLCAQGTVADYVRATALREKYTGLALNVAEAPRWIEQTSRFYYRKTVKGGHEWVLVDGATQAKTPAFDHEKLAAAIASATGRKATALELPFTTFTFVDNARSIEFALGAGPGAGARGAGAGWRRPMCRPGAARSTPIPAGSSRPEMVGAADAVVAADWRARCIRPSTSTESSRSKSPDGKLEALVNNYNVAIRETGKREVTLLSTDGSEGGYFDPESIVWSPDSKTVAIYKVKPGFRRFVHYVESSPEDQLQPKSSSMQYGKPGDVLDQELPVLFKVDTKKRLDIDTALFPNAYDMSRMAWRKDSSAVTFEYNERGHQRYRVIEVDGNTAKARAVITEEPKTFFCYSGKRFRQDIEEDERSHLDVGARWLEPSVPLRHHHRCGEEPDHQR